MTKKIVLRRELIQILNKLPNNQTSKNEIESFIASLSFINAIIQSNDPLNENYVLLSMIRPFIERCLRRLVKEVMLLAIV